MMLKNGVLVEHRGFYPLPDSRRDIVLFRGEHFTITGSTVNPDVLGKPLWLYDLRSLKGELCLRAFRWQLRRVANKEKE